MSQPWWKYVLVISVIAIAIIYALPNVYPEQPAVQVSHESRPLNEEDIQRIQTILNTDTVSG
ncbi:MAG: hypothetical protein ACNYNY_06925 [Candidatus Oxydemutatoraceae bacterium WSBS_2016_MAG_OTU14]